ncbi:cytochrome P450 [Mycena vulgaris]|nr:cytochrome P450 [Mycena vulgaris]
MNFIIASSTAAIACLIVYLLLRKNRGSDQPFPPGPPTQPVIGNILRLPTGAAWHTLMEWKIQYGDLVYLRGLGSRVLVVNSLSSIQELFEKGWNIYSHRPKFIAVGELMGLDQSLALMPYCEEWREHRKITHAALNTAAVKKWHTVQQDLAAIMVKDILDDPHNFFCHIRLTASRIVLYVGYGFFAPDMQDPYVADNEETMDILGRGMAPGAFLCDLVPILKYSPSWVPFQRQIRQSKKVIERTVYQPYRDVKKLAESGTAPPSLARDLITSGNTEPEFEHRATWAVSTMYGAGTETTAGTVHTFILAMALNPMVQKRAQTEIDNIIGTDRIPVIADMDQLPYLRALIKETLRWHPPVPLSIPRRTAKDDIYNGFFIPKDTIILPNIWAISRDTSDPEDFNPDRFLCANAPVDPFDYVFGVGRRICTGVHLAENSLFAMISSVLATLDISPVAGETLIPKFSPKHISSPELFECMITARSKAKAELMRERAADLSMGA